MTSGWISRNWGNFRKQIKPYFVFVLVGFHLGEEDETLWS